MIRRPYRWIPAGRVSGYGPHASGAASLQCLLPFTVHQYLAQSGAPAHTTHTYTPTVRAWLSRPLTPPSAHPISSSLTSVHSGTRNTPIESCHGLLADTTSSFDLLVLCRLDGMLSSSWQCCRAQQFCRWNSQAFELIWTSATPHVSECLGRLMIRPPWETNRCSSSRLVNTFAGNH